MCFWRRGGWKLPLQTDEPVSACTQVHLLLKATLKHTHTHMLSPAAWVDTWCYIWSAAPWILNFTTHALKCFALLQTEAVPPMIQPHTLNPQEMKNEFRTSVCTCTYWSGGLPPGRLPRPWLTNVCISNLAVMKTVCLSQGEMIDGESAW